MEEKTLVTINGSWSEQDNAWVSETLCLTGSVTPIFTFLSTGMIARTIRAAVPTCRILPGIEPKGAIQL